MVRKIQTKDAYYIVSDDSSLDEAALQGLATVIKQQTKVTQPNFFIDMRFDYEYVQLQALNKITELLQPIILNNLNTGSALFVESENVYLNTERNEAEVVLPLQSFGWLKHYYSKLRDAMFAMSSIQVYYPKWSPKCKSMLHGKGALCTYVSISRDETNRRRDLVHFFFSLEVATCMVNPQFGFTRLLQQTLYNSKNVYTTKIYMYICRSADAGKWIISYKDLREKLCVGDRFMRYYDFRNRILKEVENELRNNSNHWFDLVEQFTKRGNEAPNLLIFNIHSVNQQDIECLNRYKTKIYETMTESLKITKSVAQTIIRQVNVRNYRYIWRKHNWLISYMMAPQGGEIKDVKAYYVGAIQQIIQSEKYSQLPQQQSLFQ